MKEIVGFICSILVITIFITLKNYFFPNKKLENLFFSQCLQKSDTEDCIYNLKGVYFPNYYVSRKLYVGVIKLYPKFITLKIRNEEKIIFDIDKNLDFTIKKGIFDSTIVFEKNKNDDKYINTFYKNPPKHFYYAGIRFSNKYLKIIKKYHEVILKYDKKEDIIKNFIV